MKCLRHRRRSRTRGSRHYSSLRAAPNKALHRNLTSVICAGADETVRGIKGSAPRLVKYVVIP